MLTKPDIADELIISRLQEEYDLHVTSLTFLPLGADMGSVVYRVVADDGTVYFLKLRKGFNEIIVTAPLFLKSHGIQEIIAPFETKSKQGWADFGEYKMIVYPFIQGKNGFEMELSDHHKRTLGKALQQHPGPASGSPPLPLRSPRAAKSHVDIRTLFCYADPRLNLTRSLAARPSAPNAHPICAVPEHFARLRRPSNSRSAKHGFKIETISLRPTGAGSRSSKLQNSHRRLRFGHAPRAVRRLPTRCAKPRGRVLRICAFPGKNAVPWERDFRRSVFSWRRPRLGAVGAGRAVHEVVERDAIARIDARPARAVHQPHPLLHAEQPQAAPILRLESDAGILDGKPQMSLQAREPHEHLGRLGVPGHVAQGFLTDPVEARRDLLRRCQQVACRQDPIAAARRREVQFRRAILIARRADGCRSATRGWQSVELRTAQAARVPGSCRPRGSRRRSRPGDCRGR